MRKDWSLRGLFSNKYCKMRALAPSSRSTMTKPERETRPVSPTMSSGTGIQELMAAETRASQIVAEARAARGDRMKQAK